MHLKSSTTSDFLMDDCHRARKLILGRPAGISTPLRIGCVSSVPPTRSSDLTGEKNHRLQK
jgi:hypothetical protein